MLQTIAGKTVYVVEFDTIPELPITGLIPEESAYNRLIRKLMGPFENFNVLARAHMLYTGDSVYADALTQAIEKGIITEGGKYAIYVDRTAGTWEVARVIE